MPNTFPFAERNRDGCVRYVAPQTMRSALVGMGIFMVSGVERIVYLAFLGASPEATFAFVRDHWLTEGHVRASGLRRWPPPHLPTR